MMKRSTFQRVISFAILLPVIAGFVLGLAAYAADKAPAKSSSAAAKDSLLFPKDKYTEETITVKTASGETKKVVVHNYQHLQYVTKPVDVKYESLDVTVPVSIDGKAIDVSNAPILFIVGVGGYMSSPNIRDASTMQGGPSGMMGGPPGQGGPDAQGGPGGPDAQGGSGGDTQGAPGGQGGPGGQFSGAPGTMGGPPGGPGAGNNDALAEGYVIVNPGVRGRDNQFKDGTYYGKAPAAIVDLKAAVRYIRHNKGILPGNDDWIISTGCSAGGGLSSLLGASGNSPLYEPYLKEIGAADEKDNIFAADCHSPVTDLGHADMTYEWAFGKSKMRSGLADQTLSAQLIELFKKYEASLQVQGKNGFGPVNGDNLDAYMTKEYLIPEANKYLLSLTEDKRKAYLDKNASWLKWDGKTASFTYADLAANHISRGKGLPAIDGFTMKSPEPILFGDKTNNARNFTAFSIQHNTGNPNATVDPELQTVVNMMNPMYFTGLMNPDVALHWRLRHGVLETDTAPTSAVNLALSLEKMRRDDDTVLYWDAGHCQDSILTAS